MEQREKDIEFWGLPKLEAIVLQIEEAFGSSLQGRKTAPNYENILIESYKHTIITTKEILCLLKNGYPDGALACARRVYEQMIILTYLEKHKTDPDFEKMIERYWDAQSVKSLFSIAEWYAFMNNDTLKKGAENMLVPFNVKYQEIKKACRGSLASRLYWWTGDANMSLSRMEDELTDHFDNRFARLLYQRACLSVHAGPLQDAALLGRENPNGNIVYTGSTMRGFSIPLLLTVLSFWNITEIVGDKLGFSIAEHEKTVEELLIFWRDHMRE